MKTSKLLSTLVLAAAAFVPAAVASAGAKLKLVRGSVVATAAGGSASGSFHLTNFERDGIETQRLILRVRGLGGGEIAEPQYEVVLDNGTQQADLGPLRVFARGSRGVFRFDTGLNALPEGVASLDTFSGGTLRITLGGVDVATATIPVFVEPDGTNETPGSIALGYGDAVLGDVSPSGSGPVVRLSAWAVNSDRGTWQAIHFVWVRLDRGASYSLVLTGETEVSLGTFKVGTNLYGLGSHIVSTRNGNVIPGGSVGALAGRGLELRDASGAVVLTGTFPSLR